MIGRKKLDPAAGRNPWVTPAPLVMPAQEPESDPLWSDAVVMNGPARPENAASVDVSTDEPWPIRTIQNRPVLWVMGLHGGAGATTVSSLLGSDAEEVGTSWPVTTGWERPLPSLPVVAVARTHHRGLEAASRFARLWAAGTLPNSRLVGLVLIDDGPRLTSGQRTAARRLARMTPHGWHLPWNELWRLEPPKLPESSIRVRQVMKNIRAQAQDR